MKAIYKLFSIGTLIITTTACQTTSDTAEQTATLGYNKGDVVQALVNIHADSKHKRLYALNYQLPTLIPVCSEFTIDSAHSKAIKLTYKGTQYSYLWDGHTRKAGQSLADNFKLFFGDKCDSKKLNKLSKLDKSGVEQGKALIGMSKEGVIFAMGHPPIHANPNTESNYWLYWRNKWGKRSVEFSNDGKVIKIK